MAATKYGYTLKYDVSLATEFFYKIVDETRSVINNSAEFTRSEKDAVVTTGYGHIGDGNLHLNVSIPGYSDQDLQEKLSRVVEPTLRDELRQKC